MENKCPQCTECQRVDGEYCRNCEWYLKWRRPTHTTVVIEKTVEEENEMLQIIIHLKEERDVLWKALKEQHTYRLEDELTSSEIDESWSLVCNRVKKGLNNV